MKRESYFCLLNQETKHMASRRIEDLHPYLAAAYKKTAAEFDIAFPGLSKPFITCTYRSKEEQNDLFSQGRTKPGNKITNAKGGESLHNYYPSYAFDIAFVSGKEGKIDWSEDLFKKFAGIFCRNQCLEWGGNWKTFKDTPHFGFKGFKWQDAAIGKCPKMNEV